MNLSAVSKCSEWICGLTNGFICFPDNTCTQQQQSAYANCGSTFRISCCFVFNWVCIVLAIPSSAALLHHIVLFCIIAWHIGVSYLFLTDVALLIVVALWSWGKHISIHCIHGQHKNGFRLKSNWLKYTIFPRPSFKSCFKKERICRPVQTHFKNMVAT